MKTKSILAALAITAAISTAVLMAQEQPTTRDSNANIVHVHLTEQQKQAVLNDMGLTNATNVLSIIIFPNNRAVVRCRK